MRAVIIVRSGNVQRALAVVGLCLVLVLAALLLWSRWTTGRVIVPVFAIGKIVALDPGHGGRDPGALGCGGVLEKHVTLEVALRLKDLLEKAGLSAVLTREHDIMYTDGIEAEEGERQVTRKFIDLSRRLEIIHQSAADVVITIHVNSIASPRWSGAQTFYDPRAHPDSMVLAVAVQDEITRIVGYTDRVAKQRGGLFLLQKLKMPAVLVELGFISNPAEARRLADRDYQQKMAWAIFVGLVRYFAMGDKGNVRRAAP